MLWRGRDPGGVAEYWALGRKCRAAVAQLGLLLHGSDIQVYAEGAPVDCRCPPYRLVRGFRFDGTTCKWHHWLSMGGNWPSRRVACRISISPKAKLSSSAAVLQEGLQMGLTLNGSTDGRVTSRIAQRLIIAAAGALSAATGCNDGRTERAVRCRLQVLRAAEDFVQRRLGDAVTMQDMAAAAATSAQIFGVPVR